MSTIKKPLFYKIRQSSIVVFCDGTVFLICWEGNTNTILWGFGLLLIFSLLVQTTHRQHLIVLTLDLLAASLESIRWPEMCHDLFTWTRASSVMRPATLKYTSPWWWVTRVENSPAMTSVPLLSRHWLVPVLWEHNLIKAGGLIQPCSSTKAIKCLYCLSLLP